MRKLSLLEMCWICRGPTRSATVPRHTQTGPSLKTRYPMGRRFHPRKIRASQARCKWAAASHSRLKPNRPRREASPHIAQQWNGGDLGSTRASRVVVGALADHIFASSLFSMGRAEAAGEGADCNTRGACAPQTMIFVAFGEDLGSREMLDPSAPGEHPPLTKENEHVLV